MIRAALLTFAALLALERPAGAVTYQFSTPIAGDSVPVTLSLSDHPGGGVDITVSIPAGSGDLLGLFGNVVTESLVSGMSVFDPSDAVSQWQFQANQVWKVGGGNTMSPVKNWDWGVMFEAQGQGSGNPVESVSFRLNGSGITLAQLSSAANQGWVFGVRIQSTGGPEGSAKIGMATGTPPIGDAPTIDVTTPANGALLASATAPVAGTVTGAGVAVSVNGSPATVAGGNFSVTLTLADGPHTLTATATNASGMAADAVSVTVDTTPPVVTISDPVDGALTTAGSVVVTGTVADASPITSFTLNGTPLALAGGAFSATLPLAGGANPITASATDAAGHTASASVTVVRGAAPTIAISAPADGTLTNQTSIAVSGTLTGSPTPTVSVNGVAAEVTGSTFSAVVPLPAEGSNALVATAANPFAPATAQVTVVRDTTPPVVTITQPANGAQLDEATVAVSGTVVDASPITGLTIDGDPIQPGNSFATTTGLSAGSNTISVVATDAAGNAGTDSVAVTFTPSIPLTITIDTPPSGALVSKNRIPVAGLVSDPTALVSVNGVSGTLAAGTYIAGAVPLVEGANTLTATATRGAESATASVVVTYNAPPQIQITSPPDGSVLREAQVDVEGLVDDPSAYVDVNGVVASVGSTGHFRARDVSLVPGSNPLEARAIDTLGAQAVDQVAVTRQDDAPGQLEVVVIDPQRQPFALDPGSVPEIPVVAADLEDFKRSLARLGFFPEQFDTPIEDVGVGDTSDFIHVYVFTSGGQVGGDVALPAAEAFGEFSAVHGPLLAIGELEADLESVGLDAELMEQLLPKRFEADGFRRISLPVEGGGVIIP